MPEITLTLSFNEVTAIIALMGETQTKQGFYPLMAKVKMQQDSQLPKEEPQKE